MNHATLSVTAYAALASIASRGKNLVSFLHHRIFYNFIYVVYSTRPISAIQAVQHSYLLFKMHKTVTVKDERHHLQQFSEIKDCITKSKLSRHLTVV